jgi:hypothetical protein
MRRISSRFVVLGSQWEKNVRTRRGSLRGLHLILGLPRAYAPGCFMSPLRGWIGACFHGLGFECILAVLVFGRFILAWNTSGGYSVEIHASHPLQRT